MTSISNTKHSLSDDNNLWKQKSGQYLWSSKTDVERREAGQQETNQQQSCIIGAISCSPGQNSPCPWLLIPYAILDILDATSLPISYGNIFSIFVFWSNECILSLICTMIKITFQIDILGNKYFTALKSLSQEQREEQYHSGQHSDCSD